MYFFVPDLHQYMQDLGCFVDYSIMPGAICFHENELIEDDIDAIIEKSRKKSTSKNDEKMSKGFFGKFFKKQIINLSI